MTPLQEIGAQLGKELEEALPRWVEACVRNTYEASGAQWHQQIADETSNAANKCVKELMQELTELFEADVDRQIANRCRFFERRPITPLKSSWVTKYLRFREMNTLRSRSRKISMT